MFSLKITMPMKPLSKIKLSQLSYPTEMNVLWSGGNDNDSCIY